MNTAASFISVYFYNVSELFNSSDMDKLIELTHINEQIFMDKAKKVEVDYPVVLLDLEKFPENYLYEDETEFHDYYVILKELLEKFREHRRQGNLAVYYKRESAWGEDPFDYESHEVISSLKKEENYVLYDHEW